MAREFAGKFYVSKQWRKTRASVVKSNAGLCAMCEAPGVIAHHVVRVTPETINDPFTTLNEGNIVLLCRDCHKAQHRKEKEYACSERLSFDEFGNVVMKQPGIPPRVENA
jgi:5-methylcytosine-specific restriction enzyme A